MTDLMETMSLAGTLVAQIGDSGGAPVGGGGGGAGAGAGAGQGQPGGNFMNLLLPMMLAFLVLMIFSSFRAQKRDKKRREELIGSLKKHDKVQTHAGIIGTVVEVKDDQVVLKVDDATNTRIRFAKSAVSHVLSSRGGSGSSGAEAESVESDVSEADLARA
jgi:preprotein translocase subunit YajC